ncbi:molybdate ABC transporter substrate-binding protein [Rhodonellum sp.]|uniref:molybdate ABC transporter substrate-binding protein n=1 Tax=Rhodonellum sp. TaxID=2231180 RepID=UPI002715A1E8|nr:molybdate ABC transporter substrate-binding protein [Rhodonellum sp.]MDO9551235.1 molybdate ABC transporter substrate-binding protein [Rhodonellum sp.]
MKTKHFCTLILLLFCFSAPVQAQQNTRTRIAAAADLRFALDSLILVFKEKNPGKIDAIYGSSGKLFEQISNGAPFDLFFSADIAYPVRLRELGMASSEIHPYGIGRLVLWSKKMDPNQKQMKTLQDPAIRKVAIANPSHAPYGEKSVESLTHYGLYDGLEKKLVYGENISQAAQFITSGAADIGLVALSLALSPNMIKQKGKYYLIPEESHQQLLQGAILTKFGQDNKIASQFLGFVKSDQAIDILKHFGFMQPLGQ